MAKKTVVIKGYTLQILRESTMAGIIEKLMLMKRCAVTAYGKK